LHDLASTEADRAAELAAKWEAWASRANVKPYPATDGARKKGKKKQSPSTT
jgi:arylsulfatase